MKITLKRARLLLFALLIPLIDGYSQDINEHNGSLMDLNGTELFVKIVGKGEPIIIIHGGPVLDHSYLLPHFKSLAENYQLIFFDQRLSGRSTADVDTSDIRMISFIEDIEALRTSLKLGKVHILSHSWGGLLAMRYAIKYPSHLRTLTLLNSMPYTSDLWQQEQALLAQATTQKDSLARQKIMQSELFKENPPQAIEKLLLLSFKSQFYNPAHIDKLDLYISKDYMTRSSLFGNLMVDLTQYDLSEQLNELGMPVLIIYGSAEPAATLSGPIIHEQIPNSEFTIIEKSGHFPFIEQPEKFNNVILRFLNKH